MTSEDWPQTTCSSQDFSKSAPNLDKNRPQFKQMFSSRNVLSHNSDEGIMNPTSTTNTTTTPTSPNSQIKIEYDPKSSRIFLITDNNNSNVNLSPNHKKHSLDSSEYDHVNSQNSQSSDRTLKNNSSILYDRIFYRKVQQKIFSSTDFLDNPDNSIIQQQKKQASKSSGDLTNDYDYYDNFKRKGSQFSRECFFTSNNKNQYDPEDDDYDADVSLDKVNSVNSSFDEQSNSICSDASSVSRKSSTVTFRQEHDVISSSSILSRETQNNNFSINRSIEKLYKGQTKNSEISDKSKPKSSSTLLNIKKIFSKKKISSKSSSTLSTNSLVYKEFRNINDSSENLNTTRSRGNYKQI